ncbi:Cu(I)-responsive transcriptional regulator [hydrothermal vent metagenome]|uniref:Cu(I)-responsive transcriptional regulator n=1 Tax=hydrothermal vent metagenome TaxID=652676 RepID=A0A3B0RM74_9ZZZZ
MNIQAAASRAGLPVKTVRYYDDIELVAAPRRENGYRDYGDQEIHKLRFLGRARSLGFSIDECRQLMSLYEDGSRASADVKSLATRHLEEIDKKIAELAGLRKTLSDLVQNCHGDDRPDCPILEGLAGKP